MRLIPSFALNFTAETDQLPVLRPWTNALYPVQPSASAALHELAQRSESRQQETSQTAPVPHAQQTEGLGARQAMVDEKTPLLKHEEDESNGVPTLDDQETSKTHMNPVKRLSNAVVSTLRAIVSTILAPGYYIVACFFDENGNFSTIMPFRYLSRSLTRKSKRKQSKRPMTMESRAAPSEKRRYGSAADHGSRDAESESESRDRSPSSESSPARHTRSHSSSSMSSDDTDAPRPRRAIRIKTLGDQVLRDKDRRRQQNGTNTDDADPSKQPVLTVDTIKSPTTASLASKIMKYPRAPAPPRPLIPKRQPSYSLPGPSNANPQKTLIIDLDETLIHSMAKGGRMSTGHMVEVKLQTPIGVGGTVLGPQVPILYWVNKRPHCDEFLRKVSKWFNLIIFTASVQEYADPVIDWLELERKYFSARYYRQHCTFRNGAYIKDLSHVEPDLSRVMILDNSPMSYVFHEDNAIPIEGWISDPTDNDLLHLLPFFEGLQYTTDVRSLLSLRLGEATSP